MRSLFNVILVVFWSIGSISAAVLTSTACSVGSQSASGVSNCSINAANSAPSSAASITLNQVTAVPANGSVDSFTADVSESVTAVPGTTATGATNVATGASATTNINYQFTTAGPVRQGVLVATSALANFQYGPGNDSAAATLALGNISGSCPSPNNLGTCSFFGSNAPYKFNFTLGQTFSFSFSEVFQATGDPFVDGTGFANGRADITFQLFEADGTTPVAFSSTPEPSSFSLFLLAAPVAWLYRGRVSKHHL